MEAKEIIEEIFSIEKELQIKEKEKELAYYKQKVSDTEKNKRT